MAGHHPHVPLARPNWVDGPRESPWHEAQGASPRRRRCTGPLLLRVRQIVEEFEARRRTAVTHVEVRVELMVVHGTHADTFHADGLGTDRVCGHQPRLHGGLSTRALVGFRGRRLLRPLVGGRQVEDEREGEPAGGQLRLEHLREEEGEREARARWTRPPREGHHS
eukprot:scaffold289584_cov31-Tisochrysis_lutea.AAC.1